MMTSKFNPLSFPLCFMQHPEQFLCSAWIEHVPFAFSLVEMVRPRSIVELGTYGGASYCAFCESVKTLDLSTRCVAVDTWLGDEHASYYGDDVYENLKSYHDSRFAHFSELVRATFDEAVVRFENSSIDLLHIDGLHTYEAVKHDFETWLPKMSRNGVVLIHDTTERQGDFGVWRLWDQVKTVYPSFEFLHGHGLGILLVGSTMSEFLEALCSASAKEQQTIRLFYSSLGSHYTKDLMLLNARKDIGEQQRHIGEQQRHIGEQQWHIGEQQRHIESLQIQHERDMESIKILYEGSKSWRITKPLRSIVARIKK